MNELVILNRELSNAERKENKAMFLVAHEPKASEFNSSLAKLPTKSLHLLKGVEGSYRSCRKDAVEANISIFSTARFHSVTET